MTKVITVLFFIGISLNITFVTYEEEGVSKERVVLELCKELDKGEKSEKTERFEELCENDINTDENKDQGGVEQEPKRKIFSWEIYG